MIRSELVFFWVRHSPDPTYLRMWNVPVRQSQVRRQCQIMDLHRQRYTMLLAPSHLEVPRLIDVPSVLEWGTCSHI